jgi:hypothetical protein
MAVIRDRLIKGDSRYAVDYITESHEAYKYYHNRWQFLGDSYAGGFDFFMGKYMEPYYFESKDDYEKRLRQVALDNHVKSICGIYQSFLFRKMPKRDYGSIESNPNIEAFLKDADLDGRSFDSFIKAVSSSAMVYGHTWIVIDKPNSQANTRAEALQQGIRPYVSMFTPDNVLDWKYERRGNGYYELTYLKVREEIIEDEQYVREYTPEEINVYKLHGRDRSGEYVETIPNALGKVPAICVYAQRGNIRGIGVSAMGDIADMQKMIYEEYSEIEQIIRLTNHPTLVKTRDTEASAGAGSIVQMESNLDPGLKPFLLQPNGSSIESVLNSITKKVDSIDRMASVGGIRSIESRRLSGLGLQTEFQMLNAKLADFAMNLEHAEEQIWDIWAQYEGQVFDGEITYPRSFSIQDKANEIAMLKMAKDTQPADPMLVEKIDKMVLETITERSYEEVKEWYEQWKMENKPSKDMVQHGPVTSADDLVAHLRQMVEAGYTDQEIKSLHPELAKLFTPSADFGTIVQDSDNGEDQV